VSVNRSLEILRKAWEPEGLSTLERLLLVRLACYLGKDEVVFPSQATLARHCSSSDRAIRNALKVLLKRGEISIAKPSTPTMPTHYRVHPRGPEVTSTPEVTSERAEVTSTGVRKSLPTNSPLGTPKELPNMPGDAGEHVQPEFLEDQQPPKKKEKEKRPRQRDECFDALAKACGHDIGEMTPSGAKSIGKALADIRRATPEVTPSEIENRVSNYRRLHPDWTFTEHAIAKDWSKLREGFYETEETLRAKLIAHRGCPSHINRSNATPEDLAEYAEMLKRYKAMDSASVPKALPFEKWKPAEKPPPNPDDAKYFINGCDWRKSL